MPDPDRLTVSATEASALIDASPYVTRWMLYQRFAKGVDIDTKPHARMDWGKRLEPLVQEAAAEELKFLIERDQVYERNGLFGCTRDATILCPDRGLGAHETKCVFDYGTWMREWEGGDRIPRHIEIQNQVQMKVGKDGTSFGWGAISVWVCGELRHYEREPIPELWSLLDEKAEEFLASVKSGDEPDPFGSPVEVPLLTKCFPVDKGNVLDWRERGTIEEKEEAYQLAEQVRLMQWHAHERVGHEKAEKEIKAKLLGLGQGAAKLLLPHGIEASFKQVHRKAYAVSESTYVTVNAHVPAEVESKEGPL